jgi:hypothetical protein
MILTSVIWGSMLLNGVILFRGFDQCDMYQCDIKRCDMHRCDINRCDIDR